MTNGICSAEDLEMPSQIKYIQPDADGSTGLWSNFVNPFPESEILKFLRGLDYGKRKEDVWDCEARAFYGIAKARCDLRGCPIGAAIGKAIEGNFVDKQKEFHTLIVFWHHNTSVFFDPDDTLKRPVQFEPHIVIPFPVFPPNDPDAVRKDVPPFDNFTWIKQGSLALNKKYHLVDINQINECLKNRIPKCPPSQKPIELRVSEDRAFWAFINARRDFALNQSISVPIGVAFGKATEGDATGEDHGVVVIWKSCNKPVFWDVDENKEVSFSPRIVIV